MAGGLNGPPVTSGGAYAYPTMTLLQARTIVLRRLGFIGPLVGAEQRTLATIRTAVIDALGFADPFTAVQTRTLALMRADVNERLGFAAVGVSAPGMAALLNGFINEAYATTFRRLELDLGGTSFPSRLSGDSDVTVVDYLPVQTLAIALGKAHYQAPDAKVYFDMFEAQVADIARRRPPNCEETVNSIIREAREAVINKYEYGVVLNTYATFTLDADLTEVPYLPVELLAIANAKALWKQPDAKVYLDRYERFFNEIERRKPPSANDVVNECIRDAQEQLYWRYNILRNNMWWSWTTTPGSRFYDVPKSGSDAMNMRKVEWVGYQEGDTWHKLHRGIPPLAFSADDEGTPIYYELREYIELWPAPDEVITIWLKGDLGLRALAVDADYLTIDHHPVILLATANAKMHFRQPDAEAVMRQLSSYIGRLNAATHGDRRYLPDYPVPGWCPWDEGPRGVDYGMDVRREEDGGVRRME